MWLRKGYRFRPNYLHHVQSSYAAKATTLDFSRSSAPATINNWVSCATHGTIKSIVDRIPDWMVMYLINAVYFQGTWTNPFNPTLTRQGTFTTGDNRQVHVPMMSQENQFSYLRRSTFQALSMPYGTGRFTMDIVMPAPGVSLDSFAKRAGPTTWRSWMSHLSRTFLAVQVPRFTITNDFDLTTPLGEMGMAPAFHGGFDGMCYPPGCFISSVRHKTFLKVWEKGTTAAAATAVGVGASAMPMSMTVNRPFLLAIRDTTTGTLLFFGAVNDPTG
jgi:serpin B